MDQDFIPAQPEFISKDWLFVIINQFRTVKGLRLLRSAQDIVDVSTKLHPLSRGLMSSCHLVHVAYQTHNSKDEEEATEDRLFFKMAATTAEGRAMSVETRVMEREVEALLHLAPIMTKLTQQTQKDKQILLPLPDVVYGSYSSGGEGVLVCLDLLQQGYCRPQAAAGLSLPQLVAAVEGMARFHAVAAAVIAKDPEKFNKNFPSLQVNFFDSDTVYKRVNPLFKEFSKFIRRVPGFYDQYNKFESLRGSAWGLLSRSVKRRPLPPLLTVVHGHLTAENLLYKDKEVVVTDWKYVGLGSPMMDIATLMSSSAAASSRNNFHTGQILDSYFFIYCQTLAKLGINVKTLYPGFNIDSLVEEYDRCLLGAFLQSICLLTEQLRELEERFIAWEASDVSRGDKEKAGEELREVGRRAIDLLDEVSQKLGCSLWSEVLSEVEESSSLTIRIPQQQVTATKG